MRTELDVDAEVLLDALNDSDKAQALMAERGWTEEELVARAEALNKSLVESMASINVV